jgi:hypothetical protein
MPDAFDPLEILRTLEAHHVEYVDIGGLAAWLHGAPVVTTDLDLVYEVSKQNAERLEAALRALGAIYRHQLGRRIEPDAEGFLSMSGGGHHLFETTAGDIDALRASGDFDFAALAPRTVTVELEDIRVRLASLTDIIAMKEQANRDKDRAALPILRATLDEEPE